MQLSSSFATGPLFGIIIQRFGYRTSSIMGGLIMSVGWVLTAYQTSIWGLLVTFGIVTGLCQLEIGIQYFFNQFC